MEEMADGTITIFGPIEAVVEYHLAGDAEGG